MILTKEQIEKIYSYDELIWERAETCQSLIRIVNELPIQPCRMLEIGCGNGMDSMWLSSTGFIVDAIELTSTGVALAQQNEIPEGNQVTYRQANFFTENFTESFDFIYDMGFFHMYTDNKQEQQTIVEKIHSLLTSTGIWLSLIAKYGGNDELSEYRESNSMVILRGMSESEIRSLFSAYFDILELSEVDIVSKNFSDLYGPLRMYVVVSRKK
jgi:SAM-dependent methyltransferase